MRQSKADCELFVGRKTLGRHTSRDKTRQGVFLRQHRIQALENRVSFDGSSVAAHSAVSAGRLIYGQIPRKVRAILLIRPIHYSRSEISRNID